MFNVSVQSQSVIDALKRVGVRAPAEVRAAAKDTAIRIVAGAQSRAARATGETAAGIHWDLNYLGTGYVVVMGDVVGAAETGRRERLGMKSRTSTLHQMKHTGIWLEFGTSRMRARPFLFSAAELEAGAHLRRVEHALQRIVDEAAH